MLFLSGRVSVFSPLIAALSPRKPFCRVTPRVTAAAAKQNHVVIGRIRARAGAAAAGDVSRGSRSDDGFDRMQREGLQREDFLLFASSYPSPRLPVWNDVSLFVPMSVLLP